MHTPHTAHTPCCFQTHQPAAVLGAGGGPAGPYNTPHVPRVAATLTNSFTNLHTNLPPWYLRRWRTCWTWRTRPSRTPPPLRAAGR